MKLGWPEGLILQPQALSLGTPPPIVSGHNNCDHLRHLFCPGLVYILSLCHLECYPHFTVVETEAQIVWGSLDWTPEANEWLYPQPLSRSLSEDAGVAHGVGAELVVTPRAGEAFMESWNTITKKVP